MKKMVTAIDSFYIENDHKVYIICDLMSNDVDQSKLKIRLTLNSSLSIVEPINNVTTILLASDENKYSLLEIDFSQEEEAIDSAKFLFAMNIGSEHIEIFTD